MYCYTYSRRRRWYDWEDGNGVGWPNGWGKNDTIEEIVKNLVATTTGSISAQIALKQAAGDAYLRVDPIEITLTAEGTPVNVNIESNTSWTAS